MDTALHKSNIMSCCTGAPGQAELLVMMDDGSQVQMQHAPMPMSYMGHQPFASSLQQQQQQLHTTPVQQAFMLQPQAWAAQQTAQHPLVYMPVSGQQQGASALYAPQALHQFMTAQQMHPEQLSAVSATSPNPQLHHQISQQHAALQQAYASSAQQPFLQHQASLQYQASLHHHTSLHHQASLQGQPHSPVAPASSLPFPQPSLQHQSTFSQHFQPPLQSSSPGFLKNSFGLQPQISGLPQQHGSRMPELQTAISHASSGLGHQASMSMQQPSTPIINTHGNPFAPAKAYIEDDDALQSASDTQHQVHGLPGDALPFAAEPPAVQAQLPAWHLLQNSSSSHMTDSGAHQQALQTPALMQNWQAMSASYGPISQHQELSAISTTATDSQSTWEQFPQHANAGISDVAGSIPAAHIGWQRFDAPDGKPAQQAPAVALQVTPSRELRQLQLLSPGSESQPGPARGTGADGTVRQDAASWILDGLAQVIAFPGHTGCSSRYYVKYLFL